MFNWLSHYPTFTFEYIPKIKRCGLVSCGDVTTFIDLFSNKHYFMHDKYCTNNRKWILVSFLLCFTVQEVAKLPAALFSLTLLVNWQKSSSPSQLMVKSRILQHAGAAKSSRLHYINSILSVGSSSSFPIYM